MPTYVYKSVDIHGKPQHGSIEGPSESEVLSRLGRQEKFVTSIRQETSTNLSNLFTHTTRSIDDGDVYLFTHRLSMLCRSKQSIEKALGIMAQSEGKENNTDLTARVHAKVRNGETLSSALIDEQFDPFYISMIRVAESSGDPSSILEDLSHQIKHRIEVKKNISSAMQMPLFQLATLIIMTSIIFIVVIPKFEPFFEQMGNDVPLITRMLLALGALITEWGIYAVLLIGALITRFVIKLRNPDFQARSDGLLLRLPWIKQIIINKETARLSGTLAVLLSGGVSMTEAMEKAVHGCSNKAMALRLQSIVPDIRAGATLGNALRKTKTIPNEAIQFIDTGDAANNLARTLTDLADIYEDDTKRSLDRLVALMQPVMTIFMTVIVGWFLAAILLGINSVTQSML